MFRKIFLVILILALVSGCTSWSKRELTEYEKMQIFARDHHFQFIQRVGYEETKIAFKKLKKRKRIRFDSNK